MSPVKSTYRQPKSQVARAILAARHGTGGERRLRNRTIKPPLIREIAKSHNVTKHTVEKIIKFSKGLSIVRRKNGRPCKLTSDEETALVRFILWVERTGFPADKHQVEQAAIVFLQNRQASTNLAHDWYTRFRKRHENILRKTYVKAVDKLRKSFETTDQEHLETFFTNLGAIVKEFDIHSSESWNEDEAGIRMGCLRDRIEVLVCRTTRARRPDISDPANRETSTVIGAGNAVGDHIPPWLIFKTFPTESWEDMDCVPDMRFARSDTGFSNQEISLEWLRHFNKHSWSKSSRVQRRGLEFTDYFGCDEWLHDPVVKSHIYKEPPNQRPKEEEIYRLLIIDGFTGHTSYDFVEYCIMFNIILCILPPHSTHLLQPMDIGVFQPLKNAHQKALRKSLREGNLAFSREQFAAAFKAVYEEGFTTHNIMAGFEKSGI